MRRAAARSLVALAALMPALALAANKEDPDAPVRRAEALLQDAAKLEKADDCEGAYLKYREAEDAVYRITDRARLGELESVVTNKVDKLEDCYHACQPSPRQHALLASAKSYAEQGEPRRATAIVKRLLVGRNERCRFWADARAFLRTLPNQSDEDLGKLDPCEVTEDVTASLDAARRALQSHRAALNALQNDKRRLSRVDDLIDLYRAIDSTRLQVFELREDFADCDNVYKPLVDDSKELRELFSRTQDLILTGYQSQIKGLTRKIHAFKRELAAKDKKIADQSNQIQAQAAELEKIQRQFEDLSTFNEQIYSDLLDLAGTQAISFSTEVEGRRIDQPMEEIQALVSDQAKLMKALQERYPEYFQDGVNVEGLKRKKFVLERLDQLMAKFGDHGADAKLGHTRAMHEIETTIQMMGKAIAANEKGASHGINARVAGVPIWLGIPLGIGVVVLLTGVILYVRRRDPPA